MSNVSENINNQESCTPRLLYTCNSATFDQNDATDSATSVQQTPLKALALKVLERNSQCNTNATAPEKQCNFSCNSDPLKVALNLHGFSLEELKQLAGDGWPECESNPDILEAFAKSVSIRKMRESGELPKHYTKAATCQQCGPVWLWEDAPESVQACLWCFNRFNHVAIPRPEPISCSKCRYFETNELSPNAGMGSCKIGLSVRFAGQKHNCNQFHLKTTRQGSGKGKHD